MRFVLALVLLSGCAPTSAPLDAASPVDGGRGSGAACPEGSTLTYESFGRTFFDTYCTRCHASDLTGPSRMGAPVDHDFDMLVEIQEHAVHIDQQAAIGPNRANRFMPPSGMPIPGDEERRQLGEWLACGAP